MKDEAPGCLSADLWDRAVCNARDVRVGDFLPLLLIVLGMALGVIGGFLLPPVGWLIGVAFGVVVLPVVLRRRRAEYR